MRTRLLAFAALAMFMVGAVGGGAVSAREREGFTVSKDNPVEKEYPAMGAGVPTGEALINRPSACASPARSDCDTIPIEIIEPPGLNDDRDIFFTIIELHWDDSAGNNLDLYVYDNGQSTGTQEEVGVSKSSKNPEVARVPNADLGEYNIVVENSSGANTGYTIKARVTTDPFTNPNESLAPDPPKRDEPEPEQSEPAFTPPQDTSGQESPSSSSSGAPPPTLPPVEGGLSGDDDFDFGFSDLDDRITVNVDEMDQQNAAPAPRPTEKVSPAVLLASLIGAPALLVGSGVAFAWKRRRDLLL